MPRDDMPRCPHCGYAAFWQATEPGVCDGCGYPVERAREWPRPPAATAFIRRLLRLDRAPQPH